jgi:hypothetical protein
LNARALLPRLAVAAVLAAAAVRALLTRDRLDLGAIEGELRGRGGWAPAGFVASFALATVLFVPGSLFGLAGGALFGPVWGTVWNLAGATLGATLAFLAARYVASDWVARKTAGRLGQLLDGVQAEGWRFVALTRLVPLVPLNLLNSALGLTGRIPGARNLPLGELARAPQGLAGHPIVLVCTTDKRSARAAEVLRGAGLRDVRILRGGMVQWQRDAAGAGAPTPMRARP